MEPETYSGYCGITVIVTNNTGQGNITFSSLSFLEEGDEDPTGYPFIVLPTLADGATATILTAMGANDWGMDTIGSAVFNLPNGNPLNISWSLHSPQYGSNNYPQIVPGPGYTITGLTNPVVTSGDNFTYTLTISPQ